MLQKHNSFECNTICWGIAAFVGIVSMIMLGLLGGFSFIQAVFTGGLIGVLLGLILILFICREATAAADLNADEKPAQRYAREAAEKKEQRVEASGLMSSAGAGAAGAAGASGHDAGAAAGASGSTSNGAAKPDTAPADASPAASTAPAASTPAADSTPAAGSGSASGSDGGSADAAPASFMSSGVKPTTPLAGEAELASRKGQWKYDGEGDNAPADTPSGIMSAPAETAAPAAEPKAAEQKPAAPAAAAPAAAASSDTVEESKPELYEAAPSEVDDLKLISGVGPKLEQTLNDMGIYKFAQVAVWGPQEIAWVDQRLRFKGRIERDDWMSQAKILAEGGETEFSARKKK